MNIFLWDTAFLFLNIRVMILNHDTFKARAYYAEADRIALHRRNPFVIALVYSYGTSHHIGNIVNADITCILL